MRQALFQAKLVGMYVYHPEISMKLSKSEEPLAILRDRQMRKVLTIYQAQNLALQVS